MSPKIASGIQVEPVNFRLPKDLVRAVDKKIKKDEAKLRPVHAHNRTKLTEWLYRAYVEGRIEPWKT